MKDEDIERLLASARPIGPPGHLRERIFSRRPAKPAWPWAVAAAAMLALTTLLQTGAAAARAGVRASATPAVPDDETELVLTLQNAGGLSEEDARLIAMVKQMEMRIERNRPEPRRAEP